MMKSAVFYGKRDLRIEECEIPEIESFEVLINVKACGVCGTDVHIYEGEKGAANVTPPTILGHEFSGVIAKVGKDVTKFKVGDRVLVDPNCYCGFCEYCRNGLAHFCENMIGYGTTVNGGFCEYCSVNEKQVYHLMDNTSFSKGAMAEPVACCLHGIDMCNIKLSSNVVIIGGGMIGLIMMQLAKIAGAKKVIVIEVVKAKRELAKKLGANFCIDPVNEDVKKTLAFNKVKWVNTVIECVGLPSTIEQAVSIAGNKATVMMFGLTSPDETISIKPREVFSKELEIKSSFINPYTQKRAIELIDSGLIDVSSMIYKVCDLEALEEILKSKELRANGKFIIAP